MELSDESVAFPELLSRDRMRVSFWATPYDTSVSDETSALKLSPRPRMFVACETPPGLGPRGGATDPSRMLIMLTE